MSSPTMPVLSVALGAGEEAGYGLLDGLSGIGQSYRRRANRSASGVSESDLESGGMCGWELLCWYSLVFWNGHGEYSQGWYGSGG